MQIAPIKPNNCNEEEGISKLLHHRERELLTAKKFCTPE